MEPAPVHEEGTPKATFHRLVGAIASSAVLDERGGPPGKKQGCPQPSLHPAGEADRRPQESGDPGHGTGRRALLR